MPYEIKTGSPPNAKGNTAKYPFAEMKPGQYFEIPAADNGAQLIKSGSPRVSSPAHAFARRHSLTFAVRKQPDNSVRVYRVK